MIQSLALRGAEHSGLILQKDISKKVGCSAAVSDTGLTLVVKYVLKQSPKQRAGPCDSVPWLDLSATQNHLSQGFCFKKIFWR